MAEMCGMQLYKKREGFTQEDIYTLCGRDDAVATITLNPESECYSTFGEDITVCFAYTPKERKALEEDSSSMNGTKLQNTINSQEKRSPNVLEIPFEAEGGGRDRGTQSSV